VDSLDLFAGLAEEKNWMVKKQSQELQRFGGS